MTKLRCYFTQIKNLWNHIRYYNNYYLDFTEEMVLNRSLQEYRAGRLEIRNDYLSPYSIEEQRVFTKDMKSFFEDFDSHMWKDTTLKKITMHLRKFEKYDLTSVYTKKISSN